MPSKTYFFIIEFITSTAKLYINKQRINNNK